ncbi:MAG: pyrroline-5-carboxylate reductase [Phycisphaerae bacterium]|nr:pyrroline-5-carboxylate reductase [Phycisphaerae bacterium]
MSYKYKLGFIGAGNMAWAIACQVVQAGLYNSSEVIGSDIAAERRQLFDEKLKAAATDDNRRVIEEAGTVILAVKPQQAPAVLEPLAGLVGSGQLIVSIMAGVSTATIEGILGADVAVVRVMPNLALSVGAGMTAICRGARASDKDVALVAKLFRACGQTVLVDEEQMHAVTAVSGSGPAYFFYFVEAMIKSAKEAGLSDEQAKLLAKQTCLGAARTLLARPEEPAELRRQVTSKGGTTEAALEVMDEAKLGEIIRQAVLAAAKRSAELGE